MTMKKFTATAAMLLVLAMIAVSFYGCIESPYAPKDSAVESVSDPEDTAPAMLTEANVEVIPIEKDENEGLFKKFILQAGDRQIRFEGELGASKEVKVFTEDLTGDTYPEVTVVLTAYTGTGVLVQNVHVFDGVTLNEYAVEDFVNTAENYITLGTDETGSCYLIDIEGRESKTVIKKSGLKSPAEELAEIPCLNSIARYDIIEKRLVYTTSVQVSMFEFIGDVRTTCRFDGEKFVFERADLIVYE